MARRLGVAAATSGAERDVRAVALVAVLGTASAALAAWTWDPRLRPGSDDLLILGALLAIASSLIVRLRHRGEVLAVDVFEAAIAPAFVAVPGGALVVLVALAVAIAEIARRNHPVKAAFNVTQWAAAVGSAVVAVRLVQGTDEIALGSSLVLALLVAGVVNFVALALVMNLAQRVPLAETLRLNLPCLAITFAVTVPVGFVFAAAYERSQATAGLFVVPLVLLHLAGRWYVMAQLDQDRVTALHRATRFLARPVDPRDGLGQLLSDVRSSFDADAVALFLRDERGWTAWRADSRIADRQAPSVEEQAFVSALLAVATPLRITTAPGRRDPLALALAATGRLDCIAAPVAVGREADGVLCAFDRSGVEEFEQAELRVLEALAAEVAGALQKGELLDAFFEERQKLSDIVNTTSDGIFTLRGDGVVTSWNPAMEEISGRSGQEMVGSGVSLLRARGTDGRDVLLERWQHVGDLPAELQVEHLGGSPRWLSCSYSQAPSIEDNAPLLIVVARDVTSEHEVESLKRDFVSIVSHELRTPITPIKGFASVLLDAGDAVDEASRRPALEAILRQAQRLERLILNLLEVSKIESRTGMPDARPVDVATIATRVVDEFRPAWSDRTIRVVAPAAPCPAGGRELWVEQVLSNLLSNALKYAPADRPVDVEVDVDGGDVRLAVVDRGPGVPPAERERVFGRFERLHQHDTQAGTGLGLYISRQLAEAMGGSLQVRDTDGGGATFELRLPLRRGATRLQAVG